MVKKTRRQDVLVLDIQEHKTGAYIIKIAHQDYRFLPRGNFWDEDLGISSDYLPDFKDNTFYIQGVVKEADDNVLVVAEYVMEDVKDRVRAINEKYGVLMS